MLKKKLVEDEKQISLNIKNNLEDQIKVIESEKSKNNEFNTSEINRLEESIKTLRNELDIERKLVEDEKNNSLNMKNNLEENIKILEQEKTKNNELNILEANRLEDSIKTLRHELDVEKKLVEDEKQNSLTMKNNLEDQIKSIELEKSTNNELKGLEANRLEESIKTLRNELEIEKNLVEEWKSNSSNIKNNLEEQIKTLETENKNIRDKSNLSELSNMESKRLEESIKGLNIEIGIKEKLIEEEKLMALNVKNNFEDQITKLEQEKSKNHELTILEANRLDSIIKNLKHELEIEKIRRAKRYKIL